MNNVSRFSRDHVVEYSKRTVLSCVEPVCLCWGRFGASFLFSVKNLNMGHVKRGGGLFHIGVVRAVSIFVVSILT